MLRLKGNRDKGWLASQILILHGAKTSLMIEVAGVSMLLHTATWAFPNFHGVPTCIS